MNADPDLVPEGYWDSLAAEMDSWPIVEEDDEGDPDLPWDNDLDALASGPPKGEERAFKAGWEASGYSPTTPGWTPEDAGRAFAAWQKGARTMSALCRRGCHRPAVTTDGACSAGVCHEPLPITILPASPVSFGPLVTETDPPNAAHVTIARDLRLAQEALREEKEAHDETAKALRTAWQHFDWLRNSLTREEEPVLESMEAALAAHAQRRTP